MSIALGKKARSWGLCLGLILWVEQEGMLCYAAVDEAAIPPVEFSGSLVKTVKGRQYHAQVFAKGDRLRWSTSMPFEPSVDMRQSKSSGWITRDLVSAGATEGTFGDRAGFR